MKLNVKQYSWTETAASIKGELFETFPNLKDFYTVNDGILSYLEHEKPYYRLGFVFGIQDIKSGKGQAIVYYPMKKVFVFMYKKAETVPVSDTGEKFQTKRGEMEIVNINGELAVMFYRTAIITE